MEQKINALKTASKVITVMTKIGYTVMAVMACICVVMLIFLAVTGGNVSSFTVAGINIIAFDEGAFTPAQLGAICAVLLVMGGMLFTVFLLSCRMFQQISLTGEPFEETHVKTIRTIGILTAVTPIVVGIADMIASAIAGTEIPEMYTDLPGVVVGALIYCLSYIVDYGCGLRKAAGKETV